MQKQQATQVQAVGLRTRRDLTLKYNKPLHFTNQDLTLRMTTPAMTVAKSVANNNPFLGLAV